MTYQMNVTLTEPEYLALSQEATQRGISPEVVLHEALSQHLQMPVSSSRPLTREEYQAYLYYSGIADNLPTNEPDTPKEAAELKQLADIFGEGKPVSEIVIEDRGPRI